MLGVLLGAAGCGGDAQLDAAKSAAQTPEQPGPSGDALLARARSSIRGGAVADDAKGELLGSEEPQHARAARVLRAMDEPMEDHRGAPAVDKDAAVGGATPILPPSSGTTPPESPSPTGSATKKATSPSPAKVPEPGGSARVGKLAMRSDKRGGVLTIAAPSSLVVGVANQTASGIVHLIIESARANPAVLHARPKIKGAQVTAVRQGQGTIQVTLRLEPGWTLGKVAPFSGGAKVHLRAPE